MNEVTTLNERPGAVQMMSPPSETQALIAVLQQAVANPDIDIDRMERLVKLAISTTKELDADRAKKAYAAAMAQFKRNPPTIVKDAHVRYETDRGVTEYDHSTLGALCEAVISGLAAVGIYHDWKLSQVDKAIQVTCVLTHEMGHKEEFPSIPAFPDGSGGKNAIQANQSTVTYLQRSTLFSATGLAALAPPDRDGRDTGEGMPGFVTEEQAVEIRDRLKAIHADTPKSLANFLAWIKADAIEHIAASNYKVALDRIDQKGKELSAGSAK
jgi:hypothetical protein